MEVLGSLHGGVGNLKCILKNERDLDREKVDELGADEQLLGAGEEVSWLSQVDVEKHWKVRLDEEGGPGNGSGARAGEESGGLLSAL